MLEWELEHLKIVFLLVADEKQRPPDDLSGLMPKTSYIEDLRKSILKEVEEEIEKMIEEYENEQKRISKWSSLHYDLSMYIKTLQELLQKFKS